MTIADDVVILTLLELIDDMLRKGKFTKISEVRPTYKNFKNISIIVDQFLLC